MGPFKCSGRSLSLGESVDLVIVDKELHVYIPSHGVDQVVSPFAVAIPVARNSDHDLSAVDQLEPGCDRERPPVEAVEGIAFQVVGKFP